MLDGKPFSLYEYPFYDSLYEGIFPDTLLMCGRQVGKSVSAACFTVCEAVAVPYFKSLYISPTHKQTSIFSNTRISKLIRHSPALTQMMGEVVTDNVLLKILANGSELIFNYAQDDPDRVRGVTADRVIYDEVQDINYESVVPVVNECMSNSKYGYITYLGTPKTSENTIEYLWQNSTQSEWCVKCDSCNKFSFYRDQRGVGKKGLLCLTCGSIVNPRNGIWVNMKNPTGKTLVQAYHVPQLILPANSEDPARWTRIVKKLETYSESKFQNEVMGVSDSVGSRLITLEELQASCVDKTSPAGFIVGGVDWSGGGTKGLSRTVASVLCRAPGGKFSLLDYRIFPNQNPVDTIDAIVDLFLQHNITLCVGDAGEGALANSLLTKKLAGKPVYQLQYGSQSKPITWNNVDRYTADRTTLIDCFFYTIKKGGFEFPNFSFMKPAFDDILAAYEEVTSSGKKVWRHSPTSPDDSLHSILFAWVGAKILTHDLDFY